MGPFSTIGSFIAPGIGTAIGGALDIGASFLGGGGGGGGSSSGGGSAQAAIPGDYFALYGSQAAAANVPLTIAAQRFAQQQGANMGALGTYFEGLSSGQKTILKDAATDSQAARQGQMREVMGMLDAGRSLATEVGQMKTATEMLNPTFAARAGSDSLNADNRLAEALGGTNLGVKAGQEGAKLNIAQKYGDALKGMLETRAQTEAALATGSQRIAGALALNDAQSIRDLTLNQAKVKGDLALIRGRTSATRELRQDAMGRAMSGHNFCMIDTEVQATVADWLQSLDKTQKDSFLHYAKNATSDIESYLYARFMRPSYEGSIADITAWIQEKYPKQDLRKVLLIEIDSLKTDIDNVRQMTLTGMLDHATAATKISVLQKRTQITYSGRTTAH